MPMFRRQLLARFLTARTIGEMTNDSANLRYRIHVDDRWRCRSAFQFIAALFSRRAAPARPGPLSLPSLPSFSLRRRYRRYFPQIGSPATSSARCRIARKNGQLLIAAVGSRRSANSGRVAWRGVACSQSYRRDAT